MQQNKVKQSETKVLKRSSFNFSDYNPRKLSPEARKSLKKNIKENGLLGGIIINELTGRVVSGHQRVSIADEINRFDPETKENDYEIKAEVIKVDEKKEKELNIFLNSRSAQGEYDYSKLALMIPDIDVDLAGLDAVDLSMAEVYLPDPSEYEVKTYEPQIDKKIDAEIQQGKYDEQETENTDGNPQEEETEPEGLSAEERKAKVKEIKEKVKNASVYEGEPYFTVSFDSYDNKAFFMERFRLPVETRFIKGEDLANAIDGIE